MESALMKHTDNLCYMIILLCFPLLNFVVFEKSLKIFIIETHTEIH